MPRFVAAAVLPLALAGCGHPAELTAEDAWIRLAAVPGRPAAGYFTLRAGDDAATLTAVSADVAGRAEMHETMRQGAAMTMTPLRAVTIPAGGEAAFAPGGRHVMLFGIGPGIRPGAGATLTFTFADGSRLQKDARVIAAGDPAPE